MVDSNKTMDRQTEEQVKEQRDVTVANAREEIREEQENAYAKIKQALQKANLMKESELTQDELENMFEEYADQTFYAQKDESVEARQVNEDEAGNVLVTISGVESERQQSFEPQELREEYDLSDEEIESLRDGDTEPMEEKVDEGTVETAYGLHEGDVLARDENGSLYKPDDFHDNYETEDQDVTEEFQEFQADSPPRKVLEVDEEVELEAPWGAKQTIEEGGVLVKNGPEDIYGINPSEFKDTYEQLSEEEERAARVEEALESEIELDSYIESEQLDEFLSELADEHDFSLRQVDEDGVSDYVLSDEESETKFEIEVSSHAVSGHASTREGPPYNPREVNSFEKVQS